MLTIRQLERSWNQQQFRLISALCMEMRPEYSPRLLDELDGSVAAAGLTVIRLDELSQSHRPLASLLIRHILAAQEADGGWGNPLVTAICLRALLASSGQGLAIERGFNYLASLQKDDGHWPRIAFRRMPADPWVTAFILLQLSPFPDFRSAVRFPAAISHFQNEPKSATGALGTAEPQLGVRQTARHHDPELHNLTRILRLRYPIAASN